MNTIMNARAAIHHSYYWLERKARLVSRATSRPSLEESQYAQIEKLCKDKQQFYNVIDFFGLRPGRYEDHTQWALTEEDTYEMPNILEPMLDDYDASFSPQGMLIQSQINMIITLAISHAKKREARGTCAPLPGDKNYRPHRDPLTEIQTRRDQMIRMCFPCRGKRYRMSGIIDYVLWYGDREELEMNLIVFCAPTRGAIDLSVLFSYMGAIHYARNVAGKNPALYGIYSDKSDWAFVYLDNYGRYTVRVLNWTTSKQEIYTYITHIVEDAIYLMQTDYESDSEEDETASEIARCFIDDAEWEDKVELRATRP
ncbi:hypothetical protein PVAR5_4913 [Paecilomyces variotii No. 5]|uniref:Uncharacterized protein n=1 Tax=Byssochlamys spectabilis (strain No. 5 / NBRC 109023) TaxID=1356009 RepID=V5FVZ4_BYSSN|nr:hypothetical protein PVAR5_4913 [Paecilomyces variotii No. 5]